MLYVHCADLTRVHYFVPTRQPRVAARPTRNGKTDRKVLQSWSNFTTGTPVARGCRSCANQQFGTRWGPQVQAYSPICMQTELVFNQH